MAFIIDATASREDTWKQAQALQAEMFSAVSQIGELRVHLQHFGGNNLKNTGWHNSAADVRRKMAEVGCRGGHTQHVTALQNLRGNLFGGAIVIIGDSFEENHQRAMELASYFGSKKVPIFAFQEGEDETAAVAFKGMAQNSGGAYAKFGAGAKDTLLDLLKAAATFTAGGKDELLKLASRDDAAKRLASQMGVLRIGHSTP